MARSIDDMYTTILSLSRQIAELGSDDPERERLERDRERIRSRAAEIALEGRHPKSVELEIEAIEQRLAQIDEMLIKEGYMEKRVGKTIQDPGAYSTTINHLLLRHHAPEIHDLTERLARLRQVGSGGDDASRGTP